MNPKELHYLQLAILNKLLFAKSLKFSELKPDKSLENNKLSFHVDKLINFKFVEKTVEGYRLTEKGKEFANQIETETSQIRRQGKRGAVQCCMRDVNEELEFLIYTRKKHPFFGSQGYPSGKIWYGERTGDTSARELKEETNLHGEGELFMIEHHLVYTKDSEELIEDKYFYFFRYLNPTGKLEANEEGDFEWVKESDLQKYVTKPFETFDRILYITDRLKSENHGLTFEEITHYADNF